jgi:hypothetical protein
VRAASVTCDEHDTRRVLFCVSHSGYEPPKDAAVGVNTAASASPDKQASGDAAAPAAPAGGESAPKKKFDPFGGAKPRELVLKEKGVDDKPAAETRTDEPRGDDRASGAGSGAASPAKQMSPRTSTSTPAGGDDRGGARDRDDRLSPPSNRDRDDRTPARDREFDRGGDNWRDRKADDTRPNPFNTRRAGDVDDRRGGGGGGTFVLVRVYACVILSMRRRL